MPDYETESQSPLDQSSEKKPDQADLERRAARAAESLLDNEGLTGELDDPVASQLLNWGTACARRIAHSTVGLNEAEAEIAMESRLWALRRWMRSMGKWIVGQPGLEAESQMAALATIIEQSATVFGPSFTTPDQPRREVFLSQLSARRPDQLIVALRDFLEGHEDVQ